MIPQNKGIYPNWVNDKDIVNQVLNEIMKEGGRLPYSFVINADHTSEIRSRMKHLVDKMVNEKLIHISEGDIPYLEIDIEGNRAMSTGYRKYQRIKKWDGLRQSLGRISFILFILVALAVIVSCVYLIWRIVR